MKEKIMKLKEMIMVNKSISVIILGVAMAAIVAGVCVFALNNGEKKENSASAGNVKIDNEQSSKDKGEEDKNSSDKKDDGKTTDKDDKSTENDETVKDGETTGDNGQTEGNTNNNSTGNNGNAGGGNTNNSSGNGGGNNTQSGNQGGNNNSSGGNAGGNTGNSGNGNTGNSGNGNTGSSGNGNTGNTSTGNGSIGSNRPNVGNDTIQSNQSAIYDQLFNINNKVTIRFEISDEEMQKLQSDWKRYGKDASTYRRIDKMTITIGNSSYDMYDVGIRLKGNTSRMEPLVGGNINQRNLVNFKISFKQTFDDKTLYGSDAQVWSNEAERKARKNRTFAGLESLELKWNRNFDSTYTCNYWVNQMFRSVLGYAQNTTLGNLNFGNINYGVYTIYEPVDEVFIARYFPDQQGGDLYKCRWGTRSNGSWTGATYLADTTSAIGIGQDNSSKQYTYDLKTNKKSSSYSPLKNLISTLNSNSSAGTFESVVDKDRWVKFAACSYFAGNPDDMRNNYNNHYVYFLKNGKAVFIPYDNDRCLGITSGWNVQNGMVDVNPVSEYAQGAGSGQSNPLYLNSVTRKNGNNWGNNFSSDYKAQLNAIANSKWLNYNEFKKAYETFRNNYQNVAVPSSNVQAIVNDNHISGKQSTSKLAFAETGNGNVAVSTYFNKIVAVFRNTN